MKKKSTLVSQPGKAEATSSDMHANHALAKKMYRDHSICDHAHGRVNKFPFGSSHGPSAF